MSNALIAEDDTRKLFALIPPDNYRSFSFEVSVHANGRIKAEVKVYISDDDGSQSFNSSSMTGLIRKVGAYYRGLSQ